MAAAVAPSRSIPSTRSGAHQPGYRADVDGLRAVAVLLVVFWHARVLGVRSGFAGVDVFFVISGFVITGALVRDAAAGGVSIWGFYARRLRRIAPAFLVMLAVVLAAGFVIQFPGELKHTAGVALAGLALSANVVLWRQGGYWGSDAGVEPLRHVWSLSVEEQFYLVYPLLLALLIAKAPKTVSAVLAGVAVLSIGLFLALAPGSPEAAFELGPTRAWELMLGCVLALEGDRWRPPRWVCEALALSGAAMIAVGAIPNRVNFALPVALGAFGAALVIFSGQRSTLVAKALALRPVVWIGLASYSLYLWHWPLLALAASLQPTGIGWRETAALLAATLVLGFLSWRFVEQPLRRPWRDNRQRDRFLVGMGSLAGFCAVLAGVALAGQGWPARFPPQVVRLAAYADFRYSQQWEAQYRTPCYPRRDDGADYRWDACFTPTRGQNVLLWGDSHAGELAQSLSALTTRLGAHLMQASLAGCAPMATPTQSAVCRRFDAQVAARLGQTKPDVIVLAFDGSHDLASLPSLLDRLAASGSRVVLVGPPPRYPAMMAPTLARAWPHPPSLKGYRPQRLFVETAQRESIAAAQGNVRFVPIGAVVCPAHVCRFTTVDGAPMIWDYEHLSPEGAEEVVNAAVGPQVASSLSESMSPGLAKP